MTGVTLDPAWAVPGVISPSISVDPAAAVPEALLVTVDESEPINKTKTLIRHDETGFITQTILEAERPMEEISRSFTEAGIAHLLYDGPVNVLEAYVDVTKEPKQLLSKPEVSIAGDIRTIEADGIDALHLTVQPEQFTVNVWYDNKLVHQEDVSDGKIEFASDQAGAFRVTIVPGHPYKVGAFDVVAT